MDLEVDARRVAAVRERVAVRQREDADHLGSGRIVASEKGGAEDIV